MSVASMAECREHHFIMEAFAPVRPINPLMVDFPGHWGFCGGWAIDLFLARPTRTLDFLPPPPIIGGK